MARIDAAYNFLLTTYGKTTGSRFDSHKKSELRSVYNNIIKTNKDSPLYKIVQSGDAKEFAFGIKATASQMQTAISSLNEEGTDISSMLKKKVAVSSNDDAVSVHYVGNGDPEETDGFDIQVLTLAKPQVNEGNYLAKNGYAFEEGTYSFDLDMPTNSYEFQFNVNTGDTNFDIQNKISRLINQSDIGLNAEVLQNNRGGSALYIQSRQTGLAEDEDAIFSIHSNTSWNEVNTLGIGHITSPASNSSFLLNGKEHTSLSNTFTINRAFEVTMHDTTSEDDAVHIGFTANTAALGNSLEQLLYSYNNLLDIGERYSTSHNSNKLANELESIQKNHQDGLAAVGIEASEDGHLSLDREKLSIAISTGDTASHFKTLNSFKDSLQKEANRISIDPMRYIDKVVVEYKNPGHTFAAPYATSAYAGLLIDQAL